MGTNLLLQGREVQQFATDGSAWILAFDTLARKVEFVGDSVIYVGFAEVGSLGSAAAWAIKKIDISSTNIVVTWADGDTKMDNIWDNRASLSYS